MLHMHKSYDADFCTNQSWHLVLSNFPIEPFPIGAFPVGLSLGTFPAEFSRKGKVLIGHQINKHVIVSCYIPEKQVIKHEIRHVIN